MSEERVGQSIVHGELVWYRSAGAIEEDGDGFPPQKIRERLLREGGHWDVVVGTNTDRVVVLSVLRKMLGLSMAQAAGVRGGAVYRGTHVEAQWIAARLAQSGVTCSVKPQFG